MLSWEEQKRKQLVKEINENIEEEKRKEEIDQEEEIIELTEEITEEVPLPVCTTAPSAEHARASSEDEPCDDTREGVITDDEIEKKFPGEEEDSPAEESGITEHTEPPEDKVKEEESTPELEPVKEETVFNGRQVEVLSKLNVVSYHGPGTPDSHWNFWYDGIGVALPECIGQTQHVVVKKGNFDFYPAHGDFDIAYIQKPRVPKDGKRPAKFIYSFVSDYLGNEEKTKKWMLKVKPDLMGCLQYCPEELVKFGKNIGCRVELIPWFIIDKEPYVEDKKITAMCTGCIDSAYSRRKLVYNYLKNLNRKDIILSCGAFGKYLLSNDEYNRKIKKTKYYFSGGIHDRFIPPKYYEVCNNGACLVSHSMDEMDRCGFVDGETYIRIFNMNEIEDILNSDRYREIGRAGQKMVQEKHTVEARAKKIIKIFKETV